MDRGVRYEPNEKDRVIACEWSRCGVLRKRIAARLGISENTLDIHYSREMNIARGELHVECANNMYNLAHSDDEKIAKGANEYILSKICRLDTAVLEDVDHSALLGLKQALDSLVIKKEQEHEY